MLVFIYPTLLRTRTFVHSDPFCRIVTVVPRGYASITLLVDEGFFADRFFYTDPMEIMAVRAIEFMGKEVVGYR